MTSDVRGGRRWSRALTDRRVGTKIMLAVAVVAVFSVADGLYALGSLGTTNVQVKTVYGHGMQLDAIGDLRSAVNQVWLAADDYVLAADAAARATAKTALDAAEAEVTATTARYKGYALTSDAQAQVGTFDANWVKYQALLQDKLLPLSERGDTGALRALRAGDQATVLTAVRTDLDTLSNTTVTASRTEEGTAETRYRSTRVWVIIMLVASFVLGLALAVGIAQLIARPLTRCVSALNRIGEGDLTARVVVESRDEIGNLATTLNATTEAMAGMVRKVNNSSDLLASASDQLSSVSLQLSAAAEETSAQVTTVSDAAGRVSDSVQAVSAGADEMGISIREIANNASEAAGVAAGAARTAKDTNASVAKLGEASSQIGAVVALITAIAQQTNLLALNATIEAARAGAAGKGFAVVASEVKDLAQETARATDDITAQVASIQAETASAVDAIREIAEVITRINDYTTTIASAVEEQTATTGEIARSVGQAAAGSISIAENISGVAEAAQQVTVGATETQQTAAELARTAADLRHTVAAFRT